MGPSFLPLSAEGCQQTDFSLKSGIRLAAKSRKKGCVYSIPVADSPAG